MRSKSAQQAQAAFMAANPHLDPLRTSLEFRRDPDGSWFVRGHMIVEPLGFTREDEFKALRDIIISYNQELNQLAHGLVALGIPLRGEPVTVVALTALQQYQEMLRHLGSEV